MAATADEIAFQLARQVPYYPADTPVFMVGSNTFALPCAKLLEYLRVIAHYLPQHGRISMFSRIDAIASKSDSDLRELRNAGLTQLYVGTENGNNDALKLMNKGHTADEAIKQLRRIENAGIDYIAFYILGMGGKGNGIRCARDTAAMFNQLKPRRITSTGMTVTDGTGAAHLRESGVFTDASEREKIEELREFLLNLKIDTYYDGMHYLNPVHYKLKTSDKESKAQIIRNLEMILANYSDDDLEKTINRAAMEISCRPE